MRIEAGRTFRNIGNLRLDRRDFLKTGMEVMGIGALVSILGVDLAFKTSDRWPILREAGKEIYPGWIEAGITSPFIQRDKGHFYWLKEAVFTNPALTDLTRDYYNYLLINQKEKKRLNLGDALSYGVGSAYRKLKDIDKSKVSTKTSTKFEALHAGIVVFAVGFMTWFKKSDLIRLGVPLDGYKDLFDFYQGKNGIARNVYPQLFVKRGQKEQALGKELNTGQDRAVHFAQHLLLVFEYLYSKRFNLNEHEQMPFLLEKILWLFSKSEDKARALSYIVGKSYEYAALLSPDNWLYPGRDQEDIVEGPFDPMVDEDYKANKLGSETGIALIDANSVDKVIQIFHELNSDSYHDFNTEPVLFMPQSKKAA